MSLGCVWKRERRPSRCRGYVRVKRCFSGKMFSANRFRDRVDRGKAQWRAYEGSTPPISRARRAEVTECGELRTGGSMTDGAAGWAAIRLSERLEEVKRGCEGRGLDTEDQGRLSGASFYSFVASLVSQTLATDPKVLVSVRRPRGVLSVRECREWVLLLGTRHGAILSPDSCPVSLSCSLALSLLRTSAVRPTLASGSRNQIVCRATRPHRRTGP